MTFPEVVYAERFHVMNLVEDFTGALLDSLSDAERSDLWAALDFGFDAFQLAAHVGIPNELHADLRAAMGHATSQPPQFAQTKWSNQQWIERLLNGFLRLRNVDAHAELKAAKVRNKPLLIERFKIAEQHGLAPADRSLISEVECEAGARYGEVLVSPAQAVRANQAAVRLCHLIAGSW